MSRNIEISESAMEYLKSQAEPFVDTPETTFDRIVSEHQQLKNGQTPGRLPESWTDSYSLQSLPPLLHSKPEKADIAGVPIVRHTWSELVHDMIVAAAKAGNNGGEIAAAMRANTTKGNRDDTGFEYVPEAGFSFQKMDANRSCRAILGISRQFSLPVKIEFYWRDNEKAFRPGKSAVVIGP